MDIKYEKKKQVLSDSVALLQRSIAAGYSSALEGRAAGVSVNQQRQANANMRIRGADMNAPAPQQDAALQEVVVVRNSAAKKSKSVRNTVPGIVTDDEVKEDDEQDKSSGSFTIKPQSGDNTYLDAIKKETPSKQYEKYVSVRDKYKDIPVFYFTVANYFFEKGEKDIALRILSNVAELDAENYELYKLLGYKLKEVKEFDASLFAFKKVLQWRPMDPQSYRDYALALDDAGKHQQALDTLYTAITNTYADNINTMYYGIEETILPEMNRLIAVYGNKINFSKIPKKLIQAMPVDIRVVLNWNMNDTDIDLWVTDPNGEKCYYSHKATAIGGRISNDLTRGFGPEQFLLRKAIKGKYKVEVNYYGDRQLKVAGPTTVMAEIFTHFGSSNEKRQIITLQMKKEAKEGVLIGEFEF